MRRRNLRIDVCAQIEPGSAAILIRQDVRADVNVGLSRNTRRPFDSAYPQSLAEQSQQLRRLTQLQAKQIGNHLACYVVAGWTETAGHKKNFTTRK